MRVERAAVSKKQKLGRGAKTKTEKEGKTKMNNEIGNSCSIVGNTMDSSDDWDPPERNAEKESETVSVTIQTRPPPCYKTG